MHLPKIDNSTKEERQAYVNDAWKCLHDKGDDMDESEVIQAINHHAFTIQYPKAINANPAITLVAT